MPTYIFVVKKDHQPTGDETIIDLPDQNAAWEEATVTAGQILKDFGGSLPFATELAVQIQDANREPIRSIRIVSEPHSG